MPKAGIINTYTSGCPKNQNKCWYNTGSPPKTGSKKTVFECRSARIIKNPPDNTGKVNNNIPAASSIASGNNGSVFNIKEYDLRFRIVIQKFTDVAQDEIPENNRPKIR